MGQIMNDTGVRDNYDVADWDCCDIHETAYLKDGYCKDCKIEQLEAALKAEEETAVDLAENADEDMKHIEELKAHIAEFERQSRERCRHDANRIKELQAQLALKNHPVLLWQENKKLQEQVAALHKHSPYLTRLIASARKTIASDKRTMDGIEAFGEGITSCYWLDIALLCDVVEGLINQQAPEQKP